MLSPFMRDLFQIVLWDVPLTGVIGTLLATAVYWSLPKLRSGLHYPASWSISLITLPIWQLLILSNVLHPSHWVWVQHLARWDLFTLIPLTTLLQVAVALATSAVVSFAGALALSSSKPFGILGALYFNLSVLVFGCAYVLAHGML
jgi:hypothetical protein